MSSLLVNLSTEFLILIIYPLVLEGLVSFNSFQVCTKVFHLVFYFLEHIRHSYFRDCI